jgi:uncharacterized YigZ family protein
MINYKTIHGSGEALYEIQKSRFLTFIQHVSTEADAKEFIEKIRKLHWEARHCCSAFIIGEHGSLQKADDDGEPSGTAGKPLLEVLKKQSLSDLVIVVIRYFGGIKLGAGGLIRAYGKAATLGIEASQVVVKTLFARVKLSIDYALLGSVENHLRQEEINVEDKFFADKVTLVLLFPVEKASLLQQGLLDLTSAQCHFEECGSTYLDIPYDEEKS